MKYILVYWLEAPLTPNRMCEIFEDTTKAEVRIREIKSLPNYIGYHLYESNVIHWHIA
jgi:hypothetical protein